MQCATSQRIDANLPNQRSRNPSEVIVGAVGRSRKSLRARGRPRVPRQHFQRELPQRRVSKGRHATPRPHASADESLDIDVNLDFHFGHRSSANATPADASHVVHRREERRTDKPQPAEARMKGTLLDFLDWCRLSGPEAGPRRSPKVTCAQRTGNTSLSERRLPRARSTAPVRRITRSPKRPRPGRFAREQVPLSCARPHRAGRSRGRDG